MGSAVIKAKLTHVEDTVETWRSKFDEGIITANSAEVRRYTVPTSGTITIDVDATYTTVDAVLLFNNGLGEVLWGSDDVSQLIKTGAPFYYPNFPVGENSITLDSNDATTCDVIVIIIGTRT